MGIYLRQIALAAVLLCAAPLASAQSLALYPILECVTYDSATDTVTASFGYLNFEGVRLNVPFGSNNIFLPAPFFRGQPTSYEPGIYHDVFTVTFPASQTASWTLAETTVVASNDPAL